MANLAIAIKGQDEIYRFIRDAVRRGNKIESGRGGSIVLKPHLFDFRWTDDDTEAVYDADRMMVGFDKTMSELTPCETGHEIKKPTKAELHKAIRARAEIGDVSPADIDAFIDTYAKNPEGIRSYLKTLTRVLQAVIKIQDGG